MPSEHRLLFQIRKNKNNKKKIVGHSAACMQMLLQSALEKNIFLVELVQNRSIDNWTSANNALHKQSQADGYDYCRQD